MAAKVSPLTKRQAVLLDRLVAFCERCSSLDLPLRVAKVIGYGSFFRGKDRPGDVDLFVVTGEDHPLFDRFRGIVKGRLGREGGPSTPAERMRSIAEADPDVAESAEVFARWLDGFSDAMLYDHRSIVDQLFAHHPQRFARRMLHAGLPGIRARLDRDYPEATTEVVYEIWSPERPDVRSNVEQVWASDRRADLIAELRSFVDQGRPHLLQIVVLNRIADRLARSRIRAVDEDLERVWKRFDDWVLSHEFGFDPKLCVLATDRLLSGEDCDGHPDPPGLEAPGCDSLGTEEIGTLVEERRQGLKRLYDRAYVLRLSTNFLALWCFFDKRDSKLRRWEYVTTRVTEGIPASEVKPRAVQEILDAEAKRIGLG